jgi:hypothetical protein
MNKFGVAYKITKVSISRSPLGSGPESPGLLAKVSSKRLVRFPICLGKVPTIDASVKLKAEM